MAEPVLRIFSYLPNPRVWKALFAARLGGLDIETVGDKPSALSNWLWDLEPRLLSAEERDESSPNARRSRRGFGGTLWKTDAFLRAHPFGTVPAAFAPDGTGVFESNSILRAVARAAPDSTLYGRSAVEASRVDSFLDANLVFAREAQVYLLALQHDDITRAQHERMAGAYEFYLAGIEAALAHSPHLVGDVLTIADISYVCDLAQFLREGHYAEKLETLALALVSATMSADYPRALAHVLAFSERAEFPELARYLRWYRAA